MGCSSPRADHHIQPLLRRHIRHHHLCPRCNPLHTRQQHRAGFHCSRNRLRGCHCSHTRTRPQGRYRHHRRPIRCRHSHSLRRGCQSIRNPAQRQDHCRLHIRRAGLRKGLRRRKCRHCPHRQYNHRRTRQVHRVDCRCSRNRLQGCLSIHSHIWPLDRRKHRKHRCTRKSRHCRSLHCCSCRQFRRYNPGLLRCHRLRLRRYLPYTFHHRHRWRLIRFHHSHNLLLGFLSIHSHKCRRARCKCRRHQWCRRSHPRRRKCRRCPHPLHNHHHTHRWRPIRCRHSHSLRRGCQSIRNPAQRQDHCRLHIRRAGPRKGLRRRKCHHRPHRQHNHRRTHQVHRVDCRCSRNRLLGCRCSHTRTQRQGRCKHRRRQGHPHKGLRRRKCHHHPHQPCNHHHIRQWHPTGYHRSRSRRWECRYIRSRKWHRARCKCRRHQWCRRSHPRRRRCRHCLHRPHSHHHTHRWRPIRCRHSHSHRWGFRSIRNPALRQDRCRLHIRPVGLRMGLRRRKCRRCPHPLHNHHRTHQVHRADCRCSRNRLLGCRCSRIHRCRQVRHTRRTHH